MLVYLFNINITITKVCVLFVFWTYLNIVIKYKVINKWNQTIIIVMGNSYCVIGDIYECCTGGKIRIFKKWIGPPLLNMLLYVLNLVVILVFKIMFFLNILKYFKSSKLQARFFFGEFWDCLCKGEERKGKIICFY